MRVDPAGGGTDCPPYCIEHGGAVVNFGVALYARATVRRLADTREIIIRSRDFDTEYRCASLEQLVPEGPLVLLQALVHRAAPGFGLELTMEAEAPPGSGLGSSGAVGVACIGALLAAVGAPADQLTVARVADSVERDDLGMAGGSQDSYGAALGGLNLLRYRRGGTMVPEKLRVTDETRRRLEERCVLVYTGEAHLSFSIHDDIKASYALPDSPTVDAMHHLAHLAEEAAELLEAGDVDSFGDLLNESWRQLKRLHASCDSERLRAFFASAEPHMVGGKTCGVGGGGCILFMAREGSRQALEAACQTLGGTLMPFRIEMDGLTVA